ncbi:MAG: hypothetical protein PVI20_13485 [Desulfobacteraceae bacterium]
METPNYDERDAFPMRGGLKHPVHLSGDCKIVANLKVKGGYHEKV